MRTVYADILIVVNFCADFLVLYCVSKMLHLTAKTIRLAMGAGIGALCSLFYEIYAYNAHIFSIIFNVVCVALMCKAAFKYTSIGGFVKQCTSLFLVSMLLGGLMQYLVLLMVRLFENINVPNILDVKTFVLLACLASVIALKLSKVIGRGKVHITQKVVVHTDKQKSFEVTLMSDSGNILRDPYSSLPVIVLKNELCERHLNISLKDFVNVQSNVPLRLIPVKSACANALFFAFRPEGIELVCKGKSLPLQAVVAFDNGGCDYGGYDGIIPYELTSNL